MDAVRAEKEKKEQEDMVREIELLQLQVRSRTRKHGNRRSRKQVCVQEKRMRALVDQRKQERQAMDLDNARMERQIKFMKEMEQENLEAWEKGVEEEEEQERLDALKQPFSGQGFTTGAASGARTEQDAKKAAATAAAARLFSGYSPASLVGEGGEGGR